MLAPLLELDPDLALPDGTRLADALAALGAGSEWPGRSLLRRPPASALRSGSSQAAGRPAGSRPRSSGWTRLASSPAGRDSISGRRSCRVIARRMLGAIWKSAAFSSRAVDRAGGDQVVDPLQQAGERREVGADVLVGRPR